MINEKKKKVTLTKNVESSPVKPTRMAVNLKLPLTTVTKRARPREPREEPAAKRHRIRDAGQELTVDCSTNRPWCQVCKKKMRSAQALRYHHIMTHSSLHITAVAPVKELGPLLVSPGRRVVRVKVQREVAEVGEVLTRTRMVETGPEKILGEQLSESPKKVVKDKVPNSKAVVKAKLAETEKPVSARRCGECSGCLNRRDGYTCDSCRPCLDSPRLKKACEARLCVSGDRQARTGPGRPATGGEEAPAGLFSRGERVLCFEPDLGNINQLYQARVVKVLEPEETTEVETVYLVHFLGWSAGWDRQVLEGLLLKDSPAGRVLQARLAAKAADRKGRKGGHRQQGEQGAVLENERIRAGNIRDREAIAWWEAELGPRKRRTDRGAGGRGAGM
jgi:hypothetical protein